MDICDMYNCTGECYICNMNIVNTSDSNWLPFCESNSLCIHKSLPCDYDIFTNKCVTINNLIKGFVFFIEILLFNIGFGHMVNPFYGYRSNITKKTILLILYCIINLIIPLIVSLTTKILFMWYTIVCVVSCMITYICMPSLYIKQQYVNLQYNPVDYLSSDLPITPTDSIRSESLDSIENIDQESNRNSPTIQSQT